MAQQETNDFVTAFVIGAVVGVGATLLLKPDPPTRTERVMKGLEPYRKRMRKSTKRARKGLSHGAGAAADLSQELAGASRQVLGDFRSELSELLAEAREEISDAIADQVRTTRKGVRRSSKRWR